MSNKLSSSNIEQRDTHSVYDYDNSIIIKYRLPLHSLLQKNIKSLMKSELILHTLRLVTTEPNQRTLAQKLGFSVGKTNYIIKALIEKGLIKIDRFTQSENKLNYRYVLTPKGISERMTLTECFIKRKQLEYLQLSDELADMKSSMGDIG